jgi:hypothetical protein
VGGEDGAVAVGGHGGRVKDWMEIRSKRLLLM